MELKHHGIRGQRWGKRNGPPYPLDRSNYSDREKRLAKSRNVSGGLVESANTKKKGLSKGQKTAIKIGVAVAGTALVAAGAYYLYKSGKGEALLRKGKYFLNDGESGLKDLKNSNNDYNSRSPVQESSLINPRYTTHSGYQENCINCSIAYEMRRRGYQVQPGASMPRKTADAVRKIFVEIPDESIRKVDSLNVSSPEVSWLDIYSKHNEPDEVINTMYQDALQKRGKEVTEALTKEISNFPAGSRGIFNLYTKQGGHEMAWEIGKDGKVNILNPQMEEYFSNQDYNDQKLAFFGGYMNSDSVKENFNAKLPIEIIRTDNLTLSNFGKSYLTTETGHELPMSDSEKLIKDAKIAGAGGIIGMAVAGSRIPDEPKKKKENKK